MRAGDYWRNLLRKIRLEDEVRPDEYEIFDGRVIFWFYEGGRIRNILKKMNEAGIPYTIEWDREEGLVGVALRRDLFH